MGYGGRGLKKVDYDAMLGQARAHRDTANLQRAKLKSLSKQGQGLKGAWLLRLHQEVWQHEWVRLVNEGQRLEVEGEKWRVNALITATEEATTEECAWVIEVTRFMAELYQDDRKKREQDMLRDLQLLQADLKNWVKLSTCPEADRGHTPHWTELQKRLESGRQRLTGSQDGLSGEAIALGKDLRLFQDAHFNSEMVGVVPKVPAVRCSNQTLKESLVKEFENLNSHYHLVLQQLRDSHAAALE